MGNKYDLTNKRFSQLVVLGIEKSGEHKYWKCLCDCGNIKIASTSNLINGTTKSCGHERKQKEKIVRKNTSKTTKDGKRKLCHLEHQRILRIRRCMIERCECPNNNNYKYYGGKGITVCEEWRNDPLSFYDWSIENEYSDELSIDRIDPNGNYEPNNCRWANQKTQNRNKKNSVLINYKNQSKTLSEWCEILKLPYETIWYRIYKMNMDIDKAFTTPIKGTK